MPFVSFRPLDPMGEGLILDTQQDPGPGVHIIQAAPSKDYITVKESRCLDARLADRLAKVPKSRGEVVSAIHQNFSGQIIGTSHDLTPYGGLVKDFFLYFRET